MRIDRWKWQQRRTASGVVVAVWALALLAGMVPVVVASPPAQTMLNWNSLTPVTGTLDADSSRVLYSFPCAEGYPGSIVVETASGNLVTDITVVGAGFQPLATGQVVSNSPSVTLAEAFVPVGGGLCQVEVSRAGDTSGSFKLWLWSGFGGLGGFNTFELSGDPDGYLWEPYLGESIAGELRAGHYWLQVTEQNFLGYIAPEDFDTTDGTTDLFVQVDVQVEDNPGYFEYGLAFGATSDPERFWVLSFSSDSDYSLFYYDGEWNEVVGWTLSNNVDGADKSPFISIWLQGDVLALYFNGVLVDEVVGLDMNTLSGSFALVTATGVEQLEPVAIQFDNLLVTQPYYSQAATPSGGDTGIFGGNADQTTAPTPTSVLPTPTLAPPPPTAVPQSGFPSYLATWTSASSQPSLVVNELNQAGVVPSGGSVAMTVPSSYGETGSEGFSYYPLGRGSVFGNLVLSFDATLVDTGPYSGCGMHLHANAQGGSTTAMVTEDGGFLLADYDGLGEMHENSIFDINPAVYAGQGAINQVILVAVNGDYAMYVNGVLVGDVTFGSDRGTVALELYVSADDFGRTRVTKCQLNDIWLWEF